ncbi:glycine--tRNA ligase subunit beta [Gloeocapsopsis dulcis]|uniref:Glycine--tRNA ligase beta subunit n=1 Tax=Gloeocapsopsis dulcis AAB1 = 1H9 TaxID=1433147 RepID=A0A6N8FS57_9CHRO|nr:glycine--tRNA ligase subunit beta [Gloeocapsopsis dulcis]MUL35960.1 glycine--tRNA ligase subunit beta [Gloeocapsopsis dulcis AAB1 = 1H9]WNN88213.1 glycine--tRNA ligase subunit beta [Gloeocapsopsis dulcis]
MPSFLLEVGTEELPAGFVEGAIQQWRSRIPQSLQEHSLSATSINVYGTPRRLAIVIQGLPDKQPDREEEIKGPPAQAAFKDGQPTKAAQGFAKKQGVGLEALEIRTTDKGDFVFVQQRFPGRPTAELLTELVPQWIAGLEGKRLMRWGDGDLKFARPIVWLVTLLDDAVLPVELENGSKTIKSDRFSRGHRVLFPEKVIVTHANNYVDILQAAFVEVNPQQRQNKIQEQIQAAAQKVNGYAPIYPDLLAEVTNLVEFPSAVVGNFDDEFLNLPVEVITTVMVTQQRYFPVFKSNSDELLPYFMTISNGNPAKSDIIATGNAKVIRARLADGQFFYKTDLSKPLESYLPQLETVTFQENLGSVRDKVTRFSKIAELISAQLQLSKNDCNLIQRAALLCKADLVTQMVYEFPELQGVMGQKYALASGEPEAVATAVFEHYLPRSASDRLPSIIIGQVVGLADRLDTLVSIFGLGMIPTGSSDPFALRRAANAIINITWSANLQLNLQQLLEQVATDFVAAHPQTQLDDLLHQLQEFFLQRLRTQLQEGAIDYDLVNAVLGDNDSEYKMRALQDLLDVRDRALFLQSIRNNGELEKVYDTVNRSTRLAAQGELNTTELHPQLINQELFQKSSEQAFYDALVQLEPKTIAARASRDYQQLIAALAEIAPKVSNFFDGPESVLVMDSDPEIRRNRLNLLGLLRNHARVLADFGAIVKT